MAKNILVLRNGRVVTTELEVPPEGTVDIFMWNIDDTLQSKREKITISANDVVLKTENIEHANFAADIIRGIEKTVDGIKNVLIDRIPDVVELEISRGPWRGQFQYGAHMPDDMLSWSTTRYKASFRPNNIFDIDLELQDATKNDVSIIQIEHKNLKPWVIELPKKIERDDGTFCHEVLAIFGEDTDGQLYSWNGSFPKECLNEYLLHEGYGEYLTGAQKTIQLSSIDDLYEKYGSHGDDMIDAVHKPGCDTKEIIHIIESRAPKKSIRAPGPRL